jgi:hypothetical protein
VPDRAPMMERFSSRKFIAVMAWQAVFTGLLVLGQLSGDQYVNITTLLLVGYLVVNAGQHVLERRP